VRTALLQPPRAALAVPVRIAGAGLLAATAAIHLYLWLDGYRDIEWIGPLFLANAIGAAVLAVAVVVVPGRLLAAACGLGALLELGTLGGLLLSITVGVLGFVETWQAPLAVESALVEAAGAVLMGGFALEEAARYRHRRAAARG
jgi:hypothetical protein